MQKSMCWKSLVVGIICLFVGVGIQPAFAIETSNNSPSEDIEDCSICQYISNQQIIKLKSFINRLGKYDNILSFISKYNPNVREHYQELSNRFTTLTMIIGELDPNWDYPIICTILENIYLSLGLIGDDIWDIIHKYEDTNPMFANFIWLFILAPVAFLFGLISDIGYYLDCNWKS